VRSGWVEVDRFKAVFGSTARHARDHFVLETLETVKEAVWMEESMGTFTVFGRTFRIRIGGIDSGSWVVEELKTTGSKHL
jgi:hypothetical protein